MITPEVWNSSLGLNGLAVELQERVDEGTEVIVAREEHPLSCRGDESWHCSPSALPAPAQPQPLLVLPGC